MNLSQRRHAWLRRLALVAAALVLAITSLSAFIRLSNAGLGCSEWPQCYGSRLRAVQQNREPAVADSDAVTVARLAHRLVAVLALLAITTIIMVCFGNRPWLLREGALALAMLIAGDRLGCARAVDRRCADARSGDRESAWAAC